uniref:Uncharacterized protein n=1 Tax=Brassica campestris TaxID=3711 RepID=A0A3P6B2G2_BRACM|nr:unnamed protein product [Brassica rapa]
MFVTQKSKMTPDFGTWLTISLYLGECYKFKDQGFWASNSPRESISDAQIILYLLDIYRKSNKQWTGFHLSNIFWELKMNFVKKIEAEYCFMSFASILLKRPASWLSVLAPPFLHVLGLRFLHLLLTSAALFFSFFFFPISLLPSSVQSSKLHQKEDCVATENIIEEKPEKNFEIANGMDEDGAIPDDESLIELCLPSGHYVGHHNTSKKNNLYINNKVQDVRLFDIFAEFNDFIEEDNLIEIDISIGCIKYSRFEIKV